MVVENGSGERRCDERPLDLMAHCPITGHRSPDRPVGAGHWALGRGDLGQECDVRTDSVGKGKSVVYNITFYEEFKGCLVRLEMYRKVFRNQSCKP